jgi:hypothetical protein
MAKRELLLYIPLAHGASYRLKEAVATVVPQGKTEIVHTPLGLARSLRRPHNGLQLAVILAANRKKLRELLALEQILDGLRMILVLPDAEPQTVSEGHRLRPRYLALAGSDFQDVAAVLRKMLTLSELQMENAPSI